MEAAHNHAIVHCNSTKVLEYGGSQRRRAQNIDCKFSKAHDWIWLDYFNEDSMYFVETFRCRFRMCKELFVGIHNAIVNYDVYF
jgi:hypothetical protein